MIRIATPSTPGTPSVAGTLQRTGTGRAARRVISGLLLVATLASTLYLLVSLALAYELVYNTPAKITQTPATYGLAYRDVTFPSRTDHVPLKGWFIPGVLPDGHLTTDRLIITLHGNGGSRQSVLGVSEHLAKAGFAVLTFDMRGMGESPPAPDSLGYFEYRDVLGAVDYLRSGPLAYPDLPRPRVIAGWGVSMGAATMMLATAQEPAIRALVEDSGYADILPVVQREIPHLGHIPALFTPGGLLMTQLLYGIDFYDVRPVAVVGKIAPRPLLMIHDAGDTYIPYVNLSILYTAATQATGADVQEWTAPVSGHARAYSSDPTGYSARLVAFYTAALGPDQSAAAPAA